MLTTKPSLLTDTPLHYCPGCTHGIVHRLIAECVGELGCNDRAIGVAPVGCAVFAYNYFKCDMFQAAHGRAPAVATGIKRAVPDSLLFVYQGDGDLGQMAPTTLPGQKTTTSQQGRDVKTHGNPIHICELLSALDGPAFIARTSCHDVKNVLKTKAAIKKGFTYQLEKKGFSIIEVLSTCPTNFHLSPQAALDWIRDVGQKAYPVGVYKDIGENG